MNEQGKDILMPPNFVRIPAGTFMMGSPKSEMGRWDVEVEHIVTISKAFSMGKYEVTQKEWAEVMGTSLRQQRDKENPNWSLSGEGDSHPMYYVNWYEAIEYCNKRSIKEGLTLAYTINGTDVAWNKSANGYRLPTEAEWEYACRAGTNTPFSTGDNITTSQANYNGSYPYKNNAKGTYREQTWAVGSGTANAWGLYDMHGNVWEWCWDWFGDYASGSLTDPDGLDSASYRVIRGGAWGYYATRLRSAYRVSVPPTDRDYELGFRVVRL